MPLVALVVLAAAGWLLRARYMRAMNDFSMRHRRLGADGVVIGGEGFVLQREDAPAVLLLTSSFAVAVLRRRRAHGGTRARGTRMG